MGTFYSKDTRRISFDNKFELVPALIEKSIEEDKAIMDISTFSPTESHDDDFLMGNSKISKPVIDLESGDGEPTYWRRRMEDLKKEHQLINNIIQTEYIKTLEKTNKLCEAHTRIVSNEKMKSIKPCLEWRARIMKCYEENPHQPLVCAGMVQAFTNCVNWLKMEE